MLNEEIKSYNNVYKMLNDLKKGVYSSISYLCDCKMNKRNNPYYGRVKKLTVYNSIKFGVSYANVMERQATKAGNTPFKPYEVSTNTGKGNWVVGLKDILTRNEETGKEYLHIAIYPESKTESYYILDGLIVKKDSKVYEEIRSWDNSLKKAKEPCEKQKGYGVTKEVLVKTPTFILANVISIKQGAKVWKNENYPF